MLTLLSKYLLCYLSFLLWTNLEFVYLYNLNLIYIDGKKHWKNYLWVWVMAKWPSCSAFNVALSSLCHAPREQKHSTYFTEDDAKSQLLFVNSSDRARTIWPWPNPAVRAAVFCASSGKQTLSLSIFLLLFLPCSAFGFLKSAPPTLSGASAAGERGPAEDSVRWWEGRSHRVPRAWSDAVLERATDILRGVSITDYHWDRQAKVLQHGPRSDHMDGLYHLSDRDWREAQVYTLQVSLSNIPVQIL